MGYLMAFPKILSAEVSQRGFLLIAKKREREREKGSRSYRNRQESGSESKDLQGDEDLELLR